MKKVITIGGGTGNFVMLNALRHLDCEVSAIVSMADDGGSTGVLRDELGVLPPGDVRQCLIALSSSSRMLRGLMNYRFDNGCLKGHSFGNIFLSTLEKVTGSFEKAVEEAGKILAIKGKVIPVTLNPVHLKMILSNQKVLHGEDEVYNSQEIDQGYESMYLDPLPQANERAVQEIMVADVIFFSPGGLYSSLIPNLLVEGVSKALRDTHAKKVLLINLVNKKGQTTNFTAKKYLQEFTKYLGKDIFDHIIINNASPSKELVAVYAQQGGLVKNDLDNDPRVITAQLLSDKLAKIAKADILQQRSLIRHDPEKLQYVLSTIIDRA